MTSLKLPFCGLSFVEFWCWGLIFGGQGGPGPPLDPPLVSGADPGFVQGGPQIVTGLKLPFWGLSFVEFWCWGLIFGGQGGLPPPGSAPGLIPGLIPGADPGGGPGPP